MKTSTSAANFLRKLLAPLCAAILPVLFASSASAQTTTNTFFTAGTTNWVCPTNVFWVNVECWGGGGSGGAGINGGSSANSSSAGGGGGGAYASSLVAVIPGSSYAIVVGAGGAAGATASPGNDSSFASTEVLAKGGSAGGSVNGAAQAGTGGQGGSASSSVGSVKFSGGNGANGLSGAGSGGGGGSGAGTNTNGNNATANVAGAAISGGGAGGNGATSSNPGSSASPPGGGGGGAKTSSAVQRNGGAGGLGRVRLTFSPATINSSGTLSSFSAIQGSSSAAQNFGVSGVGLTAAITVTAPEGFEVATDGASYSDTLTISQTNGTASATVSVRIKSSATPGPLSGNIALSSTSTTTVNVAVSGTVEVAGQLPVVTPADFNGQVGVAFSNTIVASAAPTNFVITSGALPGGLSLNAATGLISGTPTTAITNSVSVTAQNANGTSGPASIGFAIAKGNQSIAFSAIPAKVVGDAAFNLAATATSGLPLSYSSSDESVATVSGNTVTIVGQGSTVITADQVGDGNWNAAPSVTQPLFVLPNNIAYWNFDGATPGLTPAGWTVGSVSQGNNNGTTPILAASSVSSGYTNVYGIAASGSTNAQASARTGALSTNSTGSAFFEFSVTAPVGNTNITITNISFGSRSSSTGPAAYSIRSSADNYAADLAGGSGALTTDSAWGLRAAPVSVLITNGATQTFRIYGHSGTGSASANTANWRIDDLTIGFGAPSSTPSILLTPSAVSGLSTFAGTPSSGSSYALVGTNLTNGVVIAPTTPNLEISTNNLNFTNQLTLPLAGSAVSNTTLFVRISAAAPIGALSNAAVRHISTGLTNDLNVGGNVYDPSRGASTNSLVAWDAFTQTNFGPSPWAPTLQASNLIVSNGLTRGTGVLTSGGAAARGWGGVDWSSPDASTAVASNKFATFTVAATNGYALSISAISRFDYRRSSSGPSNGIVQAKVGTNDFANVASVDYANSASSGASIPLIDLSTNAALQNVAANTPVTFRIVNFGGTNTTGTWYVYDVGNNPNVDFEISGSVVPASTPPAPSGLSYMPSSANGVVGTAITSMAPSVTGTVTNYAVSPVLPAGLSIDSNTGVISGTPSAAAPAATYTVTASNAGGSTTATVTIGVASAYQGWLNGQPQNSTNQLNYAIGGATNALATNGVAPTTQISATDLSITAIVRTNDTNLSVFGQSIVNLATGTWTNNDVTRTIPADQTGASPGTTQRQIFSTPRGVDGRKFLRLQTTLSNQ